MCIVLSICATVLAAELTTVSVAADEDDWGVRFTAAVVAAALSLVGYYSYPAGGGFVGSGGALHTD